MLSRHFQKYVYVPLPPVTVDEKSAKGGATSHVLNAMLLIFRLLVTFTFEIHDDEFPLLSKTIKVTGTIP